MANVVNATSAYVDSTGSLDIASPENILLMGVIMTSTAANAALKIRDDASSPIDKAEFRIDTTDKTQIFDLADFPLVFPNGVDIQTVTNCVATLIFTRARASR